MMKRLNNFIATALCWLVAGTAAALSPTVTKLDNGLAVVVVQDPRTPVVVHSVWYEAGSADEATFNPEKTGIAHMLEHLMFKGTPNIPAGEFSKIVARYGGIDNAFTSRDYTAYYQKIGKQHLARMMVMEAERMGNLAIEPETFIPERDVVREERRLRVETNPFGKFFEQLLAAHYAGHPYAHPVIGHAEHIENYTLADAQDWYDTFYTPNRATLLVVGDVNPAEVTELAKQYYGKQKPFRSPERNWPVLPEYEQARMVEVVDPQVQLPAFYRLYRAPSAFSGVATNPAPSAKQVAALMVLATILGDGDTGVLYKELVENQKLATAASLSYSPVQRGESSLDLFLQPKPDISLRSLQRAAEGVLKTPEKHLSEAAFKRAVAQLKAQHVYAQDDPFGLAYRLGRWLMAGGTAETYGAPIKALDALELADVKAAALYLNFTQSTSGFLVKEPRQLEPAS